MQIIVEQNKLISLLLEKQKCFNTQPRKMFYIFSYNLENGSLVYNMITGELIFLDDIETKQFNSPVCSSKELLDFLITNWFYVSNDFNEKKLSLDINNMLRFYVEQNSKKYIDSFNIFTTTDCNAHCFYCFEKDCVHRTMSKDMAYEVSNFIRQESQGNKVILRWFGGEPLYNEQAIDIISENLKFSEIDYDSSMITNGYLFDETKINKYIKLWKLNRVQITLDGTEHVYNQIKNFKYKNSGSAFIKVINNIQMLLKSDIAVSIRLNVGEYNLKDMYLLTNQLLNRFNSFKKFSIYTQQLFEYSTKENLNRTAEHRNEVSLKYLEFNKYVSRHFPTQNIGIENHIRFKHCMADSNSSISIFPDGNLGKCEHYIDSHFIGKIGQKTLNNKEIELFKEIVDLGEKCIDCRLRPSCFQLKMCPNSDKRCDIYDKMYKESIIEQKVKNSYNTYLLKNK